MTTDRLSLARALEQSGMKSDNAEHVATEIYDAIHANVATKADIRELEQRLEVCLEKLRHTITRMTIALGIVTVAGLTILHYAGLTVPHVQ